MTVANGSIILAADLNTLVTPSLALMRTDNARLPGGVPFTMEFHGVTDVSPRSCRIVIPVDMLVESIAVQTSAASAASTITVDVTGDGALPVFAMRVTGTTSAGLKKQSRLLFDNTMTANPGVSPETTSRVGRILPRGSTVDVFVTTSNTLATMIVQVVIVARSRLARETS